MALLHFVGARTGQKGITTLSISGLHGSLFLHFWRSYSCLSGLLKARLLIRILIIFPCLLYFLMFLVLLLVVLIEKWEIICCFLEIGRYTIKLFFIFTHSACNIWLYLLLWILMPGFLSSCNISWIDIWLFLILAAYERDFVRAWQALVAWSILRLLRFGLLALSVISLCFIWILNECELVCKSWQLVSIPLLLFIIVFIFFGVIFVNILVISAIPVVTLMIFIAQITLNKFILGQRALNDLRMAWLMIGKLWIIGSD